ARVAAPASASVHATIRHAGRTALRHQAERAAAAHVVRRAKPRAEPLPFFGHRISETERRLRETAALTPAGRAIRPDAELVTLIARLHAAVRHELRRASLRRPAARS